MSTDIAPTTSRSGHAFSSDQPVPQVTTALAAEPAQPPLKRLVSLDAYRGLVMVLMVSAGLNIPAVVRNFERSGTSFNKSLWQRLAYQTDHTVWVGCSLWDLIQPSFMFMVGAALAFSIASRGAKGQSFWRMFGHAVVRSVVLVALEFFSHRIGARGPSGSSPTCSHRLVWATHSRSWLRG